MNTQALIAAINTYTATANDAVKTLREAAVLAGFTTWETIAPVALQWASERYSVPLVISQSPRNKGQQVLDRSASNIEAAKRAYHRLKEAFLGDADATPEAQGERSNKTEEFEIPEDIMKLALKLATACNEYEKGRKLAATAVAQAFAGLKG